MTVDSADLRSMLRCRKICRTVIFNAITACPGHHASDSSRSLTYKVLALSHFVDPFFVRTNGLLVMCHSRISRAFCKAGFAFGKLSAITKSWDELLFRTQSQRLSESIAMSLPHSCLSRNRSMIVRSGS